MKREKIREEAISMQKKVMSISQKEEMITVKKPILQTISENPELKKEPTEEGKMGFLLNIQRSSSTQMRGSLNYGVSQPISKEHEKEEKVSEKVVTPLKISEKESEISKEEYVSKVSNEGSESKISSQKP